MKYNSSVQFVRLSSKTLRFSFFFFFLPLLSENLMSCEKRICVSLLLQLSFYGHLSGIRESPKEKSTSWCYLDKTHLSHSFLVMVVHLTHQSVAEVHSNPLNRLILPCWLKDFQQQLVDTTVLELQLLWDAEVTQSQAAVPLNLMWGQGGERRQRHGKVSVKNSKLYKKSH